MAHEQERILEEFINRGTGFSGLANRQIQLSNLPNLLTSLRISQDTLDAIRRERLARLQEQVLQDKTKLLEQLLTSSDKTRHQLLQQLRPKEQQETTPSLLIEARQTQGLRGESPKLRGFILRGLGKTRQFGTAEELRDFLNTVDPSLLQNIGFGGLGSLTGHAFSELQSVLPFSGGLKRLSPQQFITQAGILKQFRESSQAPARGLSGLLSKIPFRFGGISPEVQELNRLRRQEELNKLRERLQPTENQESILNKLLRQLEKGTTFV